jgi:hypothetical protein
LVALETKKGLEVNFKATFNASSTIYDGRYSLKRKCEQVFCIKTNCDQEYPKLHFHEVELNP